MPNHPHGAGRRQFLHTAALGLGGLAAATGAAPEALAEAAPVWRDARAGAAFKHSVCRWCYPKLTVDALAGAARRLGMQSVELLEPAEWAVARAHGLTCAMGYAPAGDPGRRLTHGWNRVEHHAWLVPGYLEGIRLAAAAGVPNVICFSGNRAGLSDAQGLENCARGLRQILPAAERAGVTICMELLNSRVDHPDYQADHTAWGGALVDRLGSARFRLLYDIYHMQIMEGDVIRTVRTHREHIGHFHTAGVPGRHEIDASQELNYPAIARAISELGFTGYVSQEFIPTRDPLASLAEAVRLCRV
jgi:hydroxypyruvate isomerase